jgi:Meckel syndrome type 1 protein
VVVGAVARTERDPAHVAEETKRMIFEPKSAPPPKVARAGRQLSFSSEVDQAWPDEPPPSEAMPAADAAEPEGDASEPTVKSAEVPDVPSVPEIPEVAEPEPAREVPVVSLASASETAEPLPTPLAAPSVPEEPTPPPAARSAPDRDPPETAPRRKSAWRWAAPTLIVLAAGAVVAVKVPAVHRLVHHAPPAAAAVAPAPASAPAPALASAPAPEASAAPPSSTASAPEAPAPFDPHAAKSALDSAAKSVAKCRRGKVFGAARALVTFGADGAVTNTAVSPPFMGSPAGACVAQAIADVHVAPFTGKPATVSHKYVVDR